MLVDTPPSPCGPLGNSQIEAENPLEHQKSADGLVGVELATPSPVVVLVKEVIHRVCINPEGVRTTANQRLVVLRPVGNGVKRLAHDADLKGMIVIRSPPSFGSIQASLIWKTTPRSVQPYIMSNEEQLSLKRLHQRYLNIQPHHGTFILIILCHHNRLSFMKQRDKNCSGYSNAKNNFCFLLKNLV